MGYLRKGIVFRTHFGTPEVEGPTFVTVCGLCNREGAIAYDHQNRPDMPIGWYGVSTTCCPHEEHYACSPACRDAMGFAINNQHEGEVIVREVEEEIVDIEQMIEDCMEASSVPKENGGPGFNDWELEFLESIQEQYGERGTLSDAQEEILTGLWDRV